MNKKSILGICILMFLVLGSFSVLAANTHDLYFNNHDGLRVEIQNGHSFGITIEYDGFFAGERKYQFINNGDGTFTEIERAVNPSYSFADIKDIVMYGLEKSAYVTLAVDQPKYDYTSFTLDKKNVHLREKSTGIFQSFPSRDWSRSNEHDVAEKLSYIFGISGSDPLIDLSTQSERTAENKRIIEYLSDKTEEQFQKIAFHFKDFTSKDLETELSAKLTASEYTRARGQLSESDFNALREWLDNNEFQYNYNNPDLNSKLVGLYENKGHFVFFMVVEDAYNKDFYENLLKVLETKIKADKRNDKIPKEGYAMILVYDSSEELLSFEDGSPYSNNLETLNYVITKGLEDAKAAGIEDVNDMVPYYVEAFIGYVDKVELSREGEIIVDTELGVVAEKNIQGEEFNGLTRKYDNYLGFTITSTHLEGHGRVTPVNNQKGTINFDNGCVLSYGLDNGNDPSYNSDQIGKLEVVQESFDSTGTFLINYYPPNKVKDIAQIRDNDELKVNVKCGGNEIKRTKIVYSVNPLVAFVSGLWTPKKDAFLQGIFTYLTGLYKTEPIFHYTSSKDLTLQAEDLKLLIEEKIAFKENDVNIKVGKIDIVAHSTGGNVARILIENLGGEEEVGSLITLSTPHEGATLVNLIFDLCLYREVAPYIAGPRYLLTHKDVEPYINTLPDGCNYYYQWLTALQGTGAMPTSDWGAIGNDLMQIRPINDGGEFLRSQNQKRVDTNYYIFSASKNVVGPLSLGRMLRSDLFRGLVGVVNPSSVDTVDSPHFVEDVQEVIRNIKVPGYIDTVLMYYLEMDSEDVSEFFPEMDAAPFLTGAVALGLNKLLDIPEEMQILFEKLIGGMVDKTMDGVVPIASTYWSNRPSGPHFVKRKVVADHASIQKAEMTHAMIKHILLENELTTFQIGSPVNLYVYDKAGNIVGMKEGELQEKIPNAQFFIEGENVQTIIIEDNEEYNIVIESFDNGSFSFSSVQENDNQAIAIYYDEVNITDKSQAFFKMDDESSLLRIDYDGDGNIDYDVQPNDVEVNEFEQEEQDFTKSFDVNMPVRDDQKKGNLVVPIAVISLILIIVVLLIIKRKQNV